MPRVRVNWQLADQTKRTFDRTLAIFADELKMNNVADVELPEPLEGRAWPHVPATPWDHMGTWHHMGTTRMDHSPTKGVVDENCKVHGLDNLFIAGSSVFPSYGANYPTMTISALSFRLADHIVEIVKSVPIG
jgi:choline dehydrogenase-like flavoprotein